MLNKPIKICIFLIYTLLIFQSYILILIPFAVFTGCEAYIYSSFADFFCPPWTIINFLAQLLFMEIPQSAMKAYSGNVVLEILSSYIWVSILFSIPYLFFYLWWKWQFILTAWGVAFIGSCYAFIILTAPLNPGKGVDMQMGLAVPFGVNAFYCLLCIVDVVQKLFWPDNRFAARIRRLLLWACIHPYDALKDLRH